MSADLGMTNLGDVFRPLAVCVALALAATWGLGRVLRDVHRAARRRALEDDVLHAAAAHHARPLLAQDPADAVGDVGLAASIGAHDHRRPGLEHGRAGGRRPGPDPGRRRDPHVVPHEERQLDDAEVQREALKPLTWTAEHTFLLDASQDSAPAADRFELKVIRPDHPEAKTFTFPAKLS